MKLAFVPGILSLARSWLETMPTEVELVPVEWRPSGADDPSAAGREFGGPGDFIEVAALQLLLIALRLSLSGTPWALACHSAGGPVVYRCLELLSSLMQDPAAIEGIAELARSWLPQDASRDLIELLLALQSTPLKLPVAIISFEGTLMACDVEGWADDFAIRSEPPDESWIREALANPSSHWTWPMARACAGSLWERCKKEAPARHLASIKQWLELPNTPGFVYVAGKGSSKRNQYIFPALREVAASCDRSENLRIEEVQGAGHNLHREAPEAVKAILSEVLLGQATSVPGSEPKLLQLVDEAKYGPAPLALMALVGVAFALLMFRVRRDKLPYIEM